MKAVVITGAGTGIGEATALLFAKNDYFCFLLGRRIEPLSLIQKKIKNSVAISCDIQNQESVAKAVEKIINSGHSIDCLVNNAGIIERNLFENVKEEEIYDQFETNLFGAMRITLKFLPILKKTGGAVINVSSTLGLHTIPGVSVYAASKAAMINWTESLALELAPTVRVNCVCPGIIKTPIHGLDHVEKNKAQEAFKAMGEMHPMNRMGEPFEIADAIYFLNQSKWATGSILSIDGGIRLR